MLRNLVSKRNVMSISLVLLWHLAAMSLALTPGATQADEGVSFKGTLRSNSW